MLVTVVERLIILIVSLNLFCGLKHRDIERNELMSGLPTKTIVYRI